MELVSPTTQQDKHAPTIQSGPTFQPKFHCYDNSSMIVDPSQRGNIIICQLIIIVFSNFLWKVLLQLCSWSWVSR